jgi:pyroglutamyl-peptidase
VRPLRLLICGFGSFPAAPRNPSAAVVESLAAQGFRPAGVEADFLVLPVAWTRSTETVLAGIEASPVDGVLLVGVAVAADGFRVETLARNRASRLRLDHDDASWRSPLIVDRGAATHRVSAPSEAIRAAIAHEGLPATLSDDAGDYLCNFVLYRLLDAQAAPMVGFLHTPQAHEFADDGGASLAEIERAVRAAADAMAP